MDIYCFLFVLAQRHAVHLYNDGRLYLMNSGVMDERLLEAQPHGRIIFNNENESFMQGSQANGGRQIIPSISPKHCSITKKWQGWILKSSFQEH